MSDFLNLNFFLKKAAAVFPRARVRRRFNNFKSFKSFPVAQTLSGWAIAAIIVVVYRVYCGGLQGLLWWFTGSIVVVYRVIESLLWWFTGSLKNKELLPIVVVYRVYCGGLRGR
jgi:hypothetical protein